MMISANTSAFAQTKWYEYAIRFLLGGIVTAAAGLIAKKFGPEIGGLFLAFPAIFPASATLIEKHERQRKEKAGLNGRRRARHAAGADAAGAALGSLGLIAFAVCVWLTLPSHSALWVIAGATAAWAALALAAWVVWKQHIFRRRRKAISTPPA